MLNGWLFRSFRQAIFEKGVQRRRCLELFYNRGVMKMSALTTICKYALCAASSCAMTGNNYFVVGYVECTYVLLLIDGTAKAFYTIDWHSDSAKSICRVSLLHLVFVGGCIPQPTFNQKPQRGPSFRRFVKYILPVKAFECTEVLNLH